MSEIPPSNPSPPPTEGGGNFAAYPRPHLEGPIVEGPGRVSVDSIRVGWDLLKSDWGPWIGGYLICLLAIFALSMPIGIYVASRTMGNLEQIQAGSIPADLMLIQILGSAIANVFYMALLIGFTWMGVQRMRGSSAGIGGMFNYRGRFGHVLVASGVYSLIFGVAMPLLQAFVMPQPAQSSDPWAALGGSMGYLIVYIALYSIGTPILLFAGVAIIDQQVSFGQAMSTTFRVLGRRLVAFTGVCVLAFLASLLGIVACCVGILATAPLYFSTISAIYSDFFVESGAQPTVAPVV